MIEDPFDVALALDAPEPLRAFNEAGVLDAADVHVARRLLALAGEDDPEVTLAAAFAVRAPRIGHVFADLRTVRETAVADAELPWPEPSRWLERLSGSSLLGGPLRLEGEALYLDRYWRDERSLAAGLRVLADAPRSEPADGLPRLFPMQGAQREAARVATSHRLAVVAGGPGTGKTWTAAGIVALLVERALEAGERPRVALAAPSAVAAARLAAEVHARAGEAGAEAAEILRGLEGKTLDRLLRRLPESRTRYRHDRSDRLPHDVVVVDETSMVSLSLMARLVEAVRPQARLVLVGDPEQLASIEAGAVLGDIARPGAPGVAELVEGRRFGSGIGAVAAAIRRGEAEAVIELLAAAPEGVEWIEDLEPVRARAVEAGRAVIEAARAGDAEGAFARLGEFRVLCAHRRGPYGVATWVERIERWLSEAIAGFAVRGRWYPGRPLLVTENDYAHGLFNGDIGVVVAHEGGVRAAFPERRRMLSPSRLPAAIETLYAMTIHKSQGSQYRTAAVLLPEPSSRVLTRELLYTAVTRAQERLILAGSEESIRAAVGRPVARASRLGARLWDRA